MPPQAPSLSLNFPTESPAFSDLSHALQLARELSTQELARFGIFIEERPGHLKVTTPHQSRLIPFHQLSQFINPHIPTRENRSPLLQHISDHTEITRTTRDAISAILNLLNSLPDTGKPPVISIDGPSGVGKSTIINVLKHVLYNHNLLIMAVDDHLAARHSDFRKRTTTTNNLQAFNHYFANGQQLIHEIEQVLAMQDEPIAITTPQKYTRPTGTLEESTRIITQKPDIIIAEGYNANNLVSTLPPDTQLIRLTIQKEVAKALECAMKRDAKKLNSPEETLLRTLDRIREYRQEYRQLLGITLPFLTDLVFLKPNASHILPQNLKAA